MKTKIIVDSTFSLEEEVVKKYNVDVIPLSINIDNETFKDNIDINVEQVVDSVQSGKKVSTSQPSPFLFEQRVLQAQKDGYDNCIVLTMSSTLSGTNQAARIGTSEIENYPFYVVDTKTTSVGAYQIFDILVRLIDEQKSFEEICKILDKLSTKTKLIISLIDLTNLVRSGRISSMKGTIASFFHVKPLIEYYEGKVKVESKLRTDNQVFEWIAKKIKEEMGNKKTVYVYTSHIRATERIVKFNEVLKKHLPNAIFKSGITTSGVISIHTAFNAVAVAWVDLD